MKTLLFLFVIISGTAFAQTNVIAAKSHSSDKVIDKNDHDNFGGPNICLPVRNVQSVEYLKLDCIVETSTMITVEGLIYDTICDHPFLQEGSIHVDRIKAMYPENTKFINFEVLNNDEGRLKHKVRSEKHSSKSSAFWLIIIGGGLFFAYLFIPKFSFKTS